MNFTVILETEYWQFEARNNLVSRCVLAHTTACLALWRSASVFGLANLGGVFGGSTLGGASLLTIKFNDYCHIFLQGGASLQVTTRP